MRSYFSLFVFVFITCLDNLLFALPLDTHLLSVAEVYSQWTENDILQDDKWSSYGSAVIVNYDAGHIFLITDIAVTGLRELKESEPVFGDVEISDYSISVVIPNGHSLQVDGIALLEDQGLALLRAPCTGLVSGKDFFSVLIPVEHEYVVGDAVNVIGKPLNMPMSVMPGTIVSLPNNVPSNNMNHTAVGLTLPDPIGFRGGPCFVENAEELECIGVVIEPDYPNPGICFIQRLPLGLYNDDIIDIYRDSNNEYSGVHELLQTL